MQYCIICKMAKQLRLLKHLTFMGAFVWEQSHLAFAHHDEHFWANFAHHIEQFYSMCGHL